MRPLTLKALRLAQVDFRPSCLPRTLECRCIHTSIPSRLPNPFSKRPAELPQPVDTPPTPPKTHPEHGLYGFFRDKKSVTPPNVLENHGRPWTAEELRRKSFEDLHTLWYKCLMERNIIVTEALDARRQGIFYGIKNIHQDRNAAVKLTMARIKFVLWERYRAWWGAHELNEEDPLLIDKMKAEEELKRKDAIERKLASTPKKVLRKLRRKKRLQFRRRQARRAAQTGEQIPETDAEREARELAEFQRLAAGGASTVKPGA